MSAGVPLPSSQTQSPTKKLNKYSKSKQKTKETLPSSQPKKSGKQRLEHQPSTSGSNLVNILSEESQDDISSDEEGYESTNDASAPLGQVRLTDVLDSEEFDWDAVKNNDDLELVVLRVPDGIKPKYLSHLSLTLPPSQATTSQKLGSLNRKSGTYDVWSLSHPSSSSSSTPDFDESRGLAVGGEELLGMNVLLPRKKKGGKLYLAPKPITHHLVLTAQPALPTPPTSPNAPDISNPTSSQNVVDTTTTNAAANVVDMYKSPERYQHPRHLLKHRFLPTGAGLRHAKSSTSLPSIPIPSSSPEYGRGRTETGVVVPVDESESPAIDAKVEEQKAKKEKKVKIKEKDQALSLESGSPTKKRKAEGEGKKAKKAKVAESQ